MIGMSMKEMSKGFFDRDVVVKAADKATRSVLSKFGAFVRTAAKSSIRKRKRESEPGKPPSSHTGLLKQFIFFAYEPDAKNVVIGPTRLNKTSGEALPSLEHGGASRIVQYRRGKKTTRAITVAARPFMAPSFEKEKTKLPAMWANSIKP